MIVQIIDSLVTAIIGDKEPVIAYDNTGFMENFRQTVRLMDLS